MILGEGYEFRWGFGFCARKDLVVDMGRKMLNANGTEAGFRGNCKVLVCTKWPRIAAMAYH